MTTTPDPKIVREIAQEATQRAARRRDYIGSALTDHDVMREILASGDRSAWGRWNDAIRAEMETATVTVSWPDEQRQDATDPARLAQIRARSRRLAAIALDVSPGDNCVVTDLVESASDVRWLLERMEQPQDDGDVRAVRDMLHGGYAARRALAARFADRIEALEARDAKAEPGGES